MNRPDSTAANHYNDLRPPHAPHQTTARVIPPTERAVANQNGLFFVLHTGSTASNPSTFFSQSWLNTWKADSQAEWVCLLPFIYHKVSRNIIVNMQEFLVTPWNRVFLVKLLAALTMHFTCTHFTHTRRDRRTYGWPKGSQSSSLQTCFDLNRRKIRQLTFQNTTYDAV